MTKVLIIGESGLGKISEAIRKAHGGVEILIVASADELITKKPDPIRLIMEDKHLMIQQPKEEYSTKFEHKSKFHN